MTFYRLFFAKVLLCFGPGNRIVAGSSKESEDSDTFTECLPLSLFVYILPRDSAKLSGISNTVCKPVSYYFLNENAVMSIERLRD